MREKNEIQRSDHAESDVGIWKEGRQGRNATVPPLRSWSPVVK